MKNLNKSLLLIAVLGMPTAVLGETCVSESNWVLGLDYYQAWRGVKRNLHRVLPSSFPGGTFYVGGKWDCLGFEFGYDSSVNVKKNWTLAPGTRVGNNLIALRTVHGKSRVRFSGLHFDVLGYLPLDPCMEFFGAIGYGRANGLRLGVGLNYMVTECLGVRAKLGYEHNASIHVNNTVENSVLDQRQPFTHAGTVSLGGFVRF